MSSHRDRGWSAPIAGLAVALSGWVAHSLNGPVVIATGLTAGALAVWMMPTAMGWLDHINGALATLTGATLGLWSAIELVPLTWDPSLSAIVSAAIVAVAAAQGLVIPAWTADHPHVPSDRQVRWRLSKGYADPAILGYGLYRHASARTPDVATRRGLHEVATWVDQLSDARRDLAREVDAIDPASVAQRIEQSRSHTTDDAFTRDRVAATTAHLRRLLGHRQTLEMESERARALMDYALAFLEEAKAGLAVGRHLPGEAAPARLGEVLERLRHHSREGSVRRQTQREMVALLSSSPDGGPPT